MSTATGCDGKTRKIFNSKVEERGAGEGWGLGGGKGWGNLGELERVVGGREVTLSTW